MNMKRIFFLLTLITITATTAVAECSHSNVTYEELDPFCNGDNGHWEYWYCYDCDKYFEDDQFNNEARKDDIFFSNYEGHYWTEWSIEEPTETEKGYMERWCQSGCAGHEYITLDKLGQSTIVIRENKIVEAVSSGMLDLTTMDGKSETSGLYMTGANFAELVTEADKDITLKFDSGSVMAEQKTLNDLAKIVSDERIGVVRLELKVNEANLLSDKQAKAAENMNAKAVMSAELLLNDKAFEEDFAGRMTVTFEYDTVNPQACELHWIKDDGTTEKVQARFDGQMCITERDHFSVYAVVEKAAEAADLPSTGDNSRLFLWLGLLLLSLCAYAAGRKVRA